MRILMLGGTIFIGRHIVDEALRRGHDVTLFHRGQRGADVHPEVPRIMGDRATDLEKIAGTWDAVIDTCGYLPRVVATSADYFKGKVGTYAFISSISAYDDPVIPPDEDSPLAQLNDPTVEEITGETYGGLKALCETTVTERFPEAFIIRPGLVAGPYDPTDRFTYWPWYLRQPGRMIVPDRPLQPTQWVDVRDLAAFIVTGVEKSLVGSYNGVADPIPFREFVERIGKVVGQQAELDWVPPESLETAGVQPWADLPLTLNWDGSADAIGQTINSRAVAAGLKSTPIEDTVRDVMAWRPTLGTDLKIPVLRQLPKP